MDPFNRKFVWEMIRRESVEKGRVVVLTTHSMEEADALGDRIGIMSHGELIAVGTGLRLKNRFGSGYEVKIVSEAKDAAAVQRRLSEILPAARLTDVAAGAMTYDIPRDKTELVPELFRWIEAGADGIAIIDWGISQTTLEEVFIQLAKRAHAENDAAAAAAAGTVSGAAVLPAAPASAPGQRVEPAEQVQRGAVAVATEAKGADAGAAADDDDDWAKDSATAAAETLSFFPTMTASPRRAFVHGCTARA